MEIVPRPSWESVFRSQGMNNPMPRIQMLDGFNEGWIEFEGAKANIHAGSTPLKTVLQTLVNRK
jgi:NAD(P)H dehydrogenase (quinone)